MNSKTKKITTFVVSTVAVIATIITLLISAPAHSTGETVETTTSVAITAETMAIQTMTETAISTIEFTTTKVEITPVPEPGELTYVKHFTRGTYYAYGGPRKGGSQRQLIDCSIGDGTVKGSIASSYLYRNYGYNYNGKRTMVYLEIEGYSQMSGYYYLDDCDAGNSNVIDFFFLYESNCPFKEQGIVQVDCYIVN